MIQLASLPQQACNDYQQYLDSVLRPAMAELDADIESRQAKLHRVFGANLFIAHAVDYIQAIRKTSGIDQGRSDFVRQFDRMFSVEGTRLSNRKFELIDAINNALKHIRLDPKRYQHLEQHYGPISFQSLYEENGRVLCILDGYRFDYARVVLHPAYEALASWDFETAEDVFEFAQGNISIHTCYADDELMASDDPADAIDQMIVACNPTCEHCREAEDDCYCAEFIFDGKQGQFEPRFRSDFDFDSVMSKISGGYSPRA